MLSSPEPQSSVRPGVNDAPDPEINPIQDPLLSKNLGRWAQVYFSAPPAERDAAVRLLLRELQAAAASSTVSGQEPEGFVCPVCQGQNPPGQRFCGFCGFLLKSRHETGTDTESASAAHQSPASETTSNDLEHLRELSFSTIYGDDEPSTGNGLKYVALFVIVLAGVGLAVYLQWGAQVRAMLGIPQPPAAVATNAPAPAAPAPATASTPNVPPASQSAATTAPNANPAQAAGGQAPAPSVTDIDSSGKPVSAAANAPAATNSPNQTAPQAATPQNSEAAGNPANTAAQSITPVKAATPVEVKTAARTETVATTAAHSRPAPKAHAAPAVDNGSQELSVAEQYLDSSNGPRNPSAAAKWLWKAVAKQNPTALVLLSNLYLQGDGVPKSCDQARILLVAAAKKGAPNVGPQLRNLEQNGCN